MVNRKSRNAFFLEHGGPQKQIREQTKSGNFKQKKDKAKVKKRGVAVTWEDSAKDYFNEIERKKNEKRAKKPK